MPYERVGGLERSLLVLLVGLTFASLGLFIGQVVLPQSITVAGLTARASGSTGRLLP